MVEAINVQIPFDTSDIENALRDIRNLARDVNGAFESLKGTARNMRSAFSDVREEAGKINPKFAEMMTFDIPIDLRPLNRGLNEIQGASKDVYSSFRNVRSATQNVGGAVSSAGDRMTETFGTIQSEASNIRDTFTESFGNVTGSVSEFRDEWSRVESLNDLVDVIGQTPKLLTDIAGEAFEVIGSFDTLRQMDIGGIITEEIAKISEAFGILFDGFQKVKESVAEVYRVMKRNFANMYEAVKKKVIKMYGAIKAKLMIAFGKMKVALAAIAKPVLIVVAILAVLVGAIMYLWNTNENFRNFVKMVWERIQSAFRVAIDFIINLFHRVVDGIHNFRERLGQFREFVSNVWSQIQNSFSNAINRINSLFRGLSNIVSNMRNIGRDIIQGMISGITGMFNRVRETIQNLGRNITGWISGVLGINSPSRVMRDQIGGPIVDGLTLGISSNASQVEKEMESLADKMTGTFDLNNKLGVNALNLADISGIPDMIHQNQPIQLVLDGQILGEVSAPYVQGTINRNSQRHKYFGGASWA